MSVKQIFLPSLHEAENADVTVGQCCFEASRAER
jgi:hypothetical protein